MTVDQWQKRGQFLKIGAHRLFFMDTASDKPALLILHGYPSSIHDFHRALAYFTPHFRVVMHDHLGFGCSDKPLHYSYSLIEQADIAVKVWQKLGIKEGVLVAHDYGTSIANELVARANAGWLPIRLQQVALSNGSMRIELAKPRPIQKLLMMPVIGELVAKLSTQAILKRNMRKIWGNPKKIHHEDIDLMWALIEYNNGRAVLPRITQYIRERTHFWNRWIGAMREATMPVHYVWGSRDPIAREIIATTMHRETPGSTLTLLKKIGHYPMLEAPEEWSKAILKSLGMQEG